MKTTTKQLILVAGSAIGFFVLLKTFLPLCSRWWQAVIVVVVSMIPADYSFSVYQNIKYGLSDNTARNVLENAENDSRYRKLINDFYIFHKLYLVDIFTNHLNFGKTANLAQKCFEMLLMQEEIDKIFSERK